MIAQQRKYMQEIFVVASTLEHIVREFNVPSSSPRRRLLAPVDPRRVRDHRHQGGIPTADQAGGGPGAEEVSQCS